MKKNFKKTGLCIVIALFTGIFAACGSSGNAGSGTSENTAEGPGSEVSTESEEGEENITEYNSFTVGFDAGFPPYGYIDTDGSYVGFDIDLAAEVSSRRGWELNLRPIDWASKDLEISSGSIDCIWNGFTINGREEQYTWTVPYVDNSQVIVAAADSGISGFDDLAGKVVLVQDDSSAYKALTNDGDENMAALLASFSQLTLVPEYNTAFMNLEAGAADAVAMDVGAAHYQIESRGDQYVILDEILVKEEYGVGFQLGNTELRDMVQETLFEMLDDGTFMTIAEKWGLADSVILDSYR